MYAFNGKGRLRIVHLDSFVVGAEYDTHDLGEDHADPDNHQNLILGKNSLAPVMGIMMPPLRSGRHKTG